MSTMALSPLQKLHENKLRAYPFFSFSSFNMASVVLSKKIRVGAGRKKDTSTNLHQHENVCRMSTMALSPLQKLHQNKLRAWSSFYFSSFNIASVVTSKKIRLGAGQKKDTSLIILDCFGGVIMLQPYWNKWITADVWVDIINNRYDIPDDLKFSTK
jgi:hypothetical protein